MRDGTGLVDDGGDAKTWSRISGFSNPSMMANHLVVSPLEGTSLGLDSSIGSHPMCHGGPGGFALECEMDLGWHWRHECHVALVVTWMDCDDGNGKQSVGGYCCYGLGARPNVTDEGICELELCVDSWERTSDVCP